MELRSEERLKEKLNEKLRELLLDAEDLELPEDALEGEELVTLESDEPEPSEEFPWELPPLDPPEDAWHWLASHESVTGVKTHLPCVQSGTSQERVQDAAAQLPQCVNPQSRVVEHPVMEVVEEAEDPPQHAQPAVVQHA